MSSPENWKPIYINQNYFVSDHGRIKCATTGEIIPPRNQRGEINGYPQVSIPIENGIKVCLVNKLVATAFVPNPTNINSFVSNIDNNGNNNHVSNLKWYFPVKTGSSEALPPSSLSSSS